MVEKKEKTLWRNASTVQTIGNHTQKQELMKISSQSNFKCMINSSI